MRYIPEQKFEGRNVMRKKIYIYSLFFSFCSNFGSAVQKTNESKNTGQSDKNVLLFKQGLKIKILIKKSDIWLLWYKDQHTRLRLLISMALISCLNGNIEKLNLINKQEGKVKLFD